MLKQLEDVVRGKSVALVGNSERILRADPSPAANIDSADVVFRMNRGLPQGMIYPRQVGRHTTIWAIAKWWPDLLPPEDCVAVLWMKLTALGDVHLKKVREQKWAAPVWLWPMLYEKECREFVGADPGTGIRLLWWLKTQAAPRSVSVYGMDCWEAPSHWSGRMNTPNHSPSLEREAMLRLL